MATLTMTAPRFHETQRFWANRFVRWVLLGTAVVLAGASAVSLATGAVGATALVWTLLLSGGLAALIATTGIETEVTDAGLRVRLTPFPGATYAWEDIASAEVRTYRPLLDYGGWGLRFGPKGMAWNAHGDVGVQLVLRSGRRVLIGSQKAEALAEEIRARLA